MLIVLCPTPLCLIPSVLLCSTLLASKLLPVQLQSVFASCEPFSDFDLLSEACLRSCRLAAPAPGLFTLDGARETSRVSVDFQNTAVVWNCVQFVHASPSLWMRACVCVLEKPYICR